MKTAMAAAALLGSAGSLGLLLPDGAAPHRIGSIELGGGAPLRLATYGAQTQMTPDQIADWAAKFGPASGTDLILLVYDAGRPVPDPDWIQSRADADWFAAQAEAAWRIDISATGAPVITALASGTDR
ncbi:MAG: hypothetical protein AAGI03_15080 [Pseudomonadota bacterium]